MGGRNIYEKDEECGLVVLCGWVFLLPGEREGR